MRIMVTGGAGFIASHVAQAYVEAGHEVLVLDNLSSGKKENVPEGARFVFGEAGSETAVEAVRIFRPEVLCHHAAQINVYVGDVVRANLEALSRGDGLSINIGTGTETDVNTLFRTLRDLSGSVQEEIHGPAMPGEQRRSVIENGMAFNELGWYPDISLDEGLALTLAYFRDKVTSSGTR